MKTVLQKLIIILICVFSYGVNAQSVSIASIDSPQGSIVAGNNYSVVFTIHNGSASVIDSIVLTYNLNGGFQSLENFNIALLPDSNAQLTFTTSFVSPALLFDLCVMIISVNGVGTNDTLCTIPFGTSLYTPPYFEDFEIVTPGWTPFNTDTLSQWELGTPNYGATNSTHSGFNCWDINLNSPYDTSAEAYLVSPLFDFTNAVNWKLSFWLNYNGEFEWDGTIMEYSTNGGVDWIRLGTLVDYNAVNWYIGTLIGNLNGWSGNSNGWHQSYYTLSQLNNAGWVQFRYKFVSDYSVNYDGVSIDDFSIDTCTLGAVESVTSNITCYGSCNGALISTVSGGVPPYNVSWSNGATTQTISSVCAGAYTVSVTDANGCSTQSGIGLSFPYEIWILPKELFNCVTLYDSVYFNVSGGTSPLTYNWSTGNTTTFAINPSPGTYTITVTDANGCTATNSISITGTTNVTYKQINQPDCYGVTGHILVYINGEYPWTYQWSNGNTNWNFFATAGIYTVTVTDANGCTYSETDTLVDPPQINIIVDSVIASGCGSSDGSFYFSTNVGSYTPYINGVQFGSTNNLAAGVYSLYLIDNACSSDTIQIVVPDSCADVWPGDANYDLVADNKDLLQIGLAYSNTGPVRPGASNTWIAQACPDWSNWFNIGVNQKHADCDGNGIIDAADTIPILLNYGLTHPLKPIIIPQVNTLAPDLYLVITQDTTGLSDSIFVNVMCGTAANPVDSIYGLAFRLYYDSALVDTSSIFFDINNSFIGTVGTNAISINKNFGVGYADFAITRTDHINASGHGPVCVMGIVTTDNVAGKMLTPVNTVLRFSLGDVYALTANENPMVLDVFGDSIFIDSTMTGINNLSWQREVKIYPNPANNYFTVASSLTNILKISMLNQFGEVIYKNEKPRLPQRINVSNITNGIYFLRIESKEGVMYRKIEIIK